MSDLIMPFVLVTHVYIFSFLRLYPYALLPIHITSYFPFSPSLKYSHPPPPFVSVSASHLTLYSGSVGDAIVEEPPLNKGRHEEGGGGGRR